KAPYRQEEGQTGMPGMTSDAHDHHDAPPCARYRLLVVEDEEQVRKALTAWFERAAFDVDTAVDGPAAVEMCMNATYDVIALDIEMPRLNGLQAIERIRQFHPDVPILILSGFSQDTRRIREVGAQRIMNKPVSLRDLEREVRALL